MTKKILISVLILFLIGLSVFFYLENEQTKEKRNYYMLPECERNKTGQITVENRTNEKYDFYIDEKFNCRLKAGETTIIDVFFGKHEIKFEEVNFMVKQTVKTDVINLKKCDKITIYINN